MDCTGQEEEVYRAARRVPAPSTDSRAVGSSKSDTPIDMLRKMLLGSPEYFDRLRRKDDAVGMKALRELRSVLMKKKDVHPYDKWFRQRGAGPLTMTCLEEDSSRHAPDLWKRAWRRSHSC